MTRRWPWHRLASARPEESTDEYAEGDYVEVEWIEVDGEWVELEWVEVEGEWVGVEWVEVDGEWVGIKWVEVDGEWVEIEGEWVEYVEGEAVEGEALEDEHAEGAAVEDEHAASAAVEGGHDEGEHAEGEALDEEHAASAAVEDEHAKDGTAEKEHAAPRPSRARPPTRTGTEMKITTRTRRAESARPLMVGALVVDAALLTLLLVTILVVRAGLDSDEEDAAPRPPDGRPALSPPPPDAAPPIGAYVQSRIDAKGEVRVRHWIRSPRPLDRIRIAPPTRPPGTEAVQVRELTVTADRRPVRVPRTLGPEGRIVELPRPRQVYLSYTMDGVVERSPSVPGRALARETALGVSYGPRAGPTFMIVQHPEVLSSACVVTSAPQAFPRPCGAPTEGGWAVVLRGVDRDDSVMAQLNLT